MSKMTDLKQQLILVAKKEEQAREELSETKKILETTIAGLQQKLSSSQKAKLTLEDELQEVSISSFAF